MCLSGVRFSGQGRGRRYLSSNENIVKEDSFTHGPEFKPKGGDWSQLGEHRTLQFKVRWVINPTRLPNSLKHAHMNEHKGEREMRD